MRHISDQAVAQYPHKKDSQCEQQLVHSGDGAASQGSGNFRQQHGHHNTLHPDTKASNDTPSVQNPLVRDGTHHRPDDKTPVVGQSDVTTAVTL